MILLIDNYDSFAHNLARYLVGLEQEVVVHRNDQMSIAEIENIKPQAIIISPRPCGPQQSGICIELVQHFYAQVPILGVCLGHQVIATAFGGEIIPSGKPVHGRESSIFHRDHSLFSGIGSPFQACRYHSLIVKRETLPGCLNVIAEIDDGTIMGIAHCDHPVLGVQFHPESILTEHGYQLLSNFLQIASIESQSHSSTRPFPQELIDFPTTRKGNESLKYPLPGVRTDSR